MFPWLEYLCGSQTESRKLLIFDFSVFDTKGQKTSKHGYKIVFVTASPFIWYGRWDLPSIVFFLHVSNLRTIKERLGQKLHKLTCWNFRSLVCLLSRGNSILSVVQNIIKLQKRKGVTPFLDQTADTGLVTRPLIFKRTVKGNVIITHILKMKKLRICKRWSSQDHETKNGWKEGKYLNRRMLEQNVSIQSKQCPNWNVVLSAKPGELWAKGKSASLSLETYKPWQGVENLF